jgi:glycosyltransferase involved in cell wall biosynthesis
MIVRKVVVSAINIHQGGTYKILLDCFEACLPYLDNVKFTFFVHRKNLLPASNHKNLELIELPRSRKSWFYRIYYEYIWFNQYSKRKPIDVWFSLHDVSPRVTSRKKVVYCHNPASFLSCFKLKYLREPTLFAFWLFYGRLYRLNSSNTDLFIIQQGWLRTKLATMLGIAESKIMVAYPFDIKRCKPFKTDTLATQFDGKKFVFFYPALARVFKNFEIIVNAVKLLEVERSDFRVVFTISKTDNLYASWIYHSAKLCKSIEFIGNQTRFSVDEIYRETNCLIFPSALETWGLPISEAKERQIPILAADLPYARETVGSYDAVSFFNVSDFRGLYELMRNTLDKTIQYEGNKGLSPQQPFVSDWEELMKCINDL